MYTGFKPSQAPLFNLGFAMGISDISLALGEETQLLVLPFATKPKVCFSSRPLTAEPPPFGRRSSWAFSYPSMLPFMSFMSHITLSLIIGFFVV